MTARPSELGSFSYEAEDSFADTADDTMTATLRIRDPLIDVSGLVQNLIDAGGVYARHNERDLRRLGGFDATFTTTHDLYGHGTTTNTSLSITPLGTLLGHVFGNSDWSQVGGNVTTQSSDVTDLQSTETTLLADGILRVGALGDTRNEGQAYVVSDNSNPYVMRTNLAAAATTADDVFAMGLVYPGSASGNTDTLTSDNSSSNNTLRIQLSTPNHAFVCRGCAAESVALSGLNAGEVPQITITWRAAAFSMVVPAADAAIADGTPVPNSAGSVFLNTVTNAGVYTVARVTVAPMDIQINLGHAIVPVTGPGGENDRQMIVAYKRIPAVTTVSYTIQADAQSATPSYFLTANPTTAYHSLVTLNTTDGAAVAFYFPRLVQTNNPTMGDWNGIRSKTIEFEARTSATTTNELTLSAWRMGLG
jgi:hypothetical protein